MIDAGGEIAQKNGFIFEGLIGEILVWVMDLLQVKILLDGFLDVFNSRGLHLMSGRGGLIR